MHTYCPLCQRGSQPPSLHPAVARSMHARSAVQQPSSVALLLRHTAGGQRAEGREAVVRMPVGSECQSVRVSAGRGQCSRCTGWRMEDGQDMHAHDGTTLPSPSGLAWHGMNGMAFTSRPGRKAGCLAVYWLSVYLVVPMCLWYVK
jgi:hypothetical protein